MVDADRRPRPLHDLEARDDSTAVTFDRHMWDELCSLRFVDAANNVMVMGPVGVGKTFLASALGHAAVRRRYSVHFERSDHLLKRLKASRLDNSHDGEIRKLLRVGLLIIDDFALQPLDALDTADVCEIIVERHRTGATITTSNREPIEWLGLMATPCWPSPRSTGSSPPPTNSSLTASPTAAAKSPASTATNRLRRPAAPPLTDAASAGRERAGTHRG